MVLLFLDLYLDFGKRISMMIKGILSDAQMKEVLFVSTLVESPMS